MLTKTAIAEANDNPEFVLHKMLRFYNALRVWYPEYRDKSLAGDESAAPKFANDGGHIHEIKAQEKSD